MPYKRWLSNILHFEQGLTFTGSVFSAILSDIQEPKNDLNQPTFEVLLMKNAIHPELFEITARCACGNAFETRSTSDELHVTVCSNCHPFFTGSQKFVDTAGRIEKFQKKFAKKA